MKNVRRIAIMIMACFFLLLWSGAYANDEYLGKGSANPDPNGLTIEVEGKPQSLAAQSFIVNGTTLAPAQQLADVLGYDFSWEPSSKAMTLEKDGWEMKLVVDQKEAMVNGEAVPLLEAPQWRENALYIPLRFVAEQDGREVQWFGDERRIVVHREGTLHVIRIMVPLQAGNEERMEEYARWTDELYKSTRISLEWEWVPEENYINKLNVMLAAGFPPDIAYVPDPAYYPGELLQFFALELGSKLDEYPNLAGLAEQSWHDVRQADGQIYGIPKVSSPYDSDFPVIRQDWLDILGYATPETMEQLYMVMRGFTEMDPDGNRIKDTYGLAGTMQTDGLGNLAWVEHVFNGVAGRFAYDDQGGIIDTWTQEGTREALQWLSDAYGDGLLVLVEESKEVEHDLTEGKGGIAAASMHDTWLLNQALEEKDDASSAFVPLISLRKSDELDDADTVVTMKAASDGMYFLDRGLSEEKIQLILGLWDALAGVERSVLDLWGGSALVDETLGVRQLTALSGGNMPEETKATYEDVLLQRSEIELKPSADLEVMKRLSNEQRADLNALNREAMEMKTFIIKGEASIEKWPTFIAVMQTDPRYIDIMDALR